MKSFDYENFDDDPEEQGKRKENFEEEIRKLAERLKDGGGGSTNIEVLEEIVNYYIEHDKHEEALHFVSLLLEYIPFSSDTWQRKGTVLNNLLRHEEALECFECALRLNPVDSELILSKGYTLDTLGRFEEAIGAFDKVLEIDSSNEEALFSKGMTYEHMDRFEDASLLFKFIVDGNSFHNGPLCTDLLRDLFHLCFGHWDVSLIFKIFRLMRIIAGCDAAHHACKNGGRASGCQCDPGQQIV